MKDLILLAFLTFLINSCSSHQERIDYRLMQCQKMCSSGNITQVKNLGCACNFNNRASNPTLNNQSRSISSSHGNTMNVYTSPGYQNAPSRIDFTPALTNMMNHEENRLNRLNRDLNSIQQPAPINNNFYSYPPQQSSIGTNSFGGF